MFWLWYFVCNAVFAMVLIAYATHVSLSCKNAQRRADAYKVLKLLGGGGVSVSVAIALLQLQQSGVA